MAKVPEDEITTEDINKWYKLAAKLKLLKFDESSQRKRIFNGLFPKPVEGAKNKYDLADDFVLTGTYPMDRKIDEAAYDSLKKEMKEAKIPVDKIFVPTFKFGKAAYNALTDEQKHLVEQALIIKPGSPLMAIAKPASAL